MQTFTRLDARAHDFEQGFRALLSAKREVSRDVDDAAATIIADVVAREYTIHMHKRVCYAEARFGRQGAD